MRADSAVTTKSEFNAKTQSGNDAKRARRIPKKWLKKLGQPEVDLQELNQDFRKLCAFGPLRLCVKSLLF